MLFGYSTERGIISPRCVGRSQRRLETTLPSPTLHVPSRSIIAIMLVFQSPVKANKIMLSFVFVI
jgi:hypothetical protein